MMALNASKLSILALLVLSAITAKARKGYGAGKQDWGYIQVREGAHMFYWLYHTTADVPTSLDRPLVIWLQGGPGASSTGSGNFEILGPIDEYGQPRNYTWVKHVNVLYIDSPVGSGFSYVENNDKLVTRNEQAAEDLVNFMLGFYKLNPQFESVPLHIFGQSYDSKIGAEFALKLHYANLKRQSKFNLASITLASSFISPKDTILNYAPYLFHMGLIDADQALLVQKFAEETAKYIKMDHMRSAKSSVESARGEVDKAAIEFNDMNILEPPLNETEAFARMETVMNVKVVPKLGIQRKWAYYSPSVYAALDEDLMRSVVHIVIKLLHETLLQVNVITGQLDFVCNTPGTLKWIDTLDWHGKTEFKNATRVGIRVNGSLEGYEKSGGRLNLFWVSRSGHILPKDNPRAMEEILRRITKFDQK